jgi:hypothetical protein
MPPFEGATDGATSSVEEGACDDGSCIRRSDRRSRPKTACSIWPYVASRSGTRATSTMSHPPRMTSESRLLNRFRVTAFPTLRLTEKAKRLTPLALALRIRTRQWLCQEQPLAFTCCILVLLLSRCALLNITVHTIAYRNPCHR